MLVLVPLVAGAGGRLCFPRLCMAFPVSFRREAMSWGGREAHVRTCTIWHVAGRP